MRPIVEATYPGEVISNELEARGWTQQELAEILDRPLKLVNEIIKGKSGITPETAKGLEAAFEGISAEFWLNLQAQYQLSKIDFNGNEVSRRAKLYDYYPVTDIIRRKWVDQTDDINQLENNFCQFLNVKSLFESKSRKYAWRKSTPNNTVNSAQEAWLARCHQLAGCINVAQFSKEKLATYLDKLKKLTSNSEGACQVPQFLSEVGIRFLVVEPLPHTRVDGVAFWIDDAPVIALSLRFDRIDGFWHTLMHELAHVLQEDGKEETFIDTDLVGELSSGKEDIQDFERTADKFAANFLVSQDYLDDFIFRVGPMYSKAKIQKFAEAMGVHPGIIVGQLQHRREIPFSHSRETLTKVRDDISKVALTDGWGHVPPDC